MKIKKYRLGIKERKKQEEMLRKKEEERTKKAKEDYKKFWKKMRILKC